MPLTYYTPSGLLLCICEQDSTKIMMFGILLNGETCAYGTSLYVQNTLCIKVHANDCILAHIPHIH